MTIRSRLSLAQAHRRVVHVTFEARVGEAPAQDVAFPVWTPGSYLVREHQRHVHDLRAELDGRPASIEKVSKSTYRIETGGGGLLRLSYEVYAHDLTVRTSHVDSTHAFLNPVGLVPYLPGREGEPQSLELADLPTGWGAACALPESSHLVFAAKDYDELVDSPIECGPHARPEHRARYEVRGIHHEIVFWGRSPLDRDRYVADCAKLTEAQAALFGSLPYERYLFIVLASDSARGGLEHRASSALLFARHSVARPKGYEDFLGLTSHELFHAWNVKRIKPAAFTPYDLSRENLTTLLWAFEGLTSYYEDIALVRAGLMSKARFIELIGEHITQLARNPGRLRHSVAEASRDAWIRYYRQDENWNNSSTSYYLKGSLVGLLFDLEVRRLTNGERSLDDVMRKLWVQFGRTGTGVPENGIEAVIEQVAGQPLQSLFDLALRSTEELPLATALASHGLETKWRVPNGLDDGGGPAPAGTPLRSEIGLGLANDHGRVRIAHVRRGSPAEDAGLCPGDELVAIDGLRAEPSTALARLHDRVPGTRLELAFFRREELQSASLLAALPKADAVQVVENPAATEGERRLLTRWLGA